MREIRIGDKTFDEWAELANSDPGAFEKMRLAAIDRCIQDLPVSQQQRMRRLQWRIEQERRMARTPMNACLRISRMMWDTVLGNAGLQKRLAELGGMAPGGAAMDPVSRPALTKADVLEFSRSSE